ncbi:hypothetical protein CMUS01_03679 [Colletotrichum musicola]|uniref:Uncharacterized protein n=1 Tax=Colletotrichum musicola TaxID=2175873 RepID=A0A8H6NR31_9PEZI|nr:hypothetical protein CMUS01_03679 [Colletotrichum musicola]
METGGLPTPGGDGGRRRRRGWGRRKERLSREYPDGNRRIPKKLKGRAARTNLLRNEERQPEWESPPCALASDLLIVSFPGRSALPPLSEREGREVDGGSHRKEPRLVPGDSATCSPSRFVPVPSEHTSTGFQTTLWNRATSVSPRRPLRRGRMALMLAFHGGRSSSSVLLSEVYKTPSITPSSLDSLLFFFIFFVADIVWPAVRSVTLTAVLALTSPISEFASSSWHPHLSNSAARSVTLFTIAWAARTWLSRKKKSHRTRSPVGTRLTFTPRALSPPRAARVLAKAADGDRESSSNGAAWPGIDSLGIIWHCAAAIMGSDLTPISPVNAINSHDTPRG